MGVHKKLSKYEWEREHWNKGKLAIVSEIVANAKRGKQGDRIPARAAEAAAAAGESSHSEMWEIDGDGMEIS